MPDLRESMFQKNPRDFLDEVQNLGLDQQSQLKLWQQCQAKKQLLRTKAVQAGAIICSMPPTDRFTIDLVPQLLPQSLDCVVFYFWSNPPYELEQWCARFKSSKRNVIMVIKDSLCGWRDVDWWNRDVLAGAAWLQDMAIRCPDNNFVILTSLENLDQEFSCLPGNLQLVSCGGDLVNQQDLYAQVDPVLDKDLSSKYSFISLNRHRRPARKMLISYLYGRGLETTGHISHLFLEPAMLQQDLLHDICWQFDLPRHDQLRNTILQGWEKIQHNRPESPGLNIYPENVINDNVSNFEQNLRPMYRQSFVELTVETTFEPASFLLTDKTQNIFFACNFPILLSGRGAVQHLRHMGMDMFDDVIDHGYDSMSNPMDRLAQAVDRNFQILSDPDLAKTQWLRCRDRMAANAEAIKTIAFRYGDRARAQMSRVRWNQTQTLPKDI
jgi:hypothetical protein